MNIKIEAIIKQIKNYGNLQDLALIRRAYEFASKAHNEQQRFSGEPYLNHPLRTALTLTKMKLSAPVIAASILHDVVEDTPFSLVDIEKEFGKEIAFLVNGLTKVSKIKYYSETTEKENFRNMILAMAEDLRIILIKLADRLDNAQTFWALAPEKQKRIALETLEIYAPLAYRLGIADLGAKLEDASFPYAFPQEYKLTRRLSGKRQKEMENYIQKIVPIIKHKIQEAGLPILEIKFRAKHLYSIWRKLQKENLDIKRIYDLVAMRIITKTIADCYAILGIVHQIWKPVPGRFKDYIAIPKPNGYQSLHTTVFAENGKITEIQIRTKEMNETAEWGIAASWIYASQKDTKAYKQRKQFRSPKKFYWINQLCDYQKNFFETKKFIESLKIDFFKERIFVLTPKGDVIDLPAGATPIDFAYQIHSEIGNQAISAKINGCMVPLNYQLNSGEVVEIITQKNKLPSASWLEFVKMAETKRKIEEVIKKKKSHLYPSKKQKK